MINFVNVKNFAFSLYNFLTTCLILQRMPKRRQSYIIISNMTQQKQLTTDAIAVLRANDRGIYTVPAAEIYPHQWLWDSCFVAIGQRHYDVDRAKTEILSLLRGQWSNGMIPHMIFASDSQWRKHQNIWQSWVSPLSPDDVLTSGITQPPMLAEAIVRIGEKLDLTERRSWYRQTFPSLLRYHQWLFAERSPHAEGLVLQIHPWETGMDNTPPWMKILHEHLLPTWVRALRATRLDKLVNVFRQDIRHSSNAERFDTVESLALFDIQRRLRRKQYQTDRALSHSMFAIEDLAFNCIFIRANDHLLDIAKTIRADIPKEFLRQTQLAKKALEDLWDPYANQYFSRDFITHKLIKEPSVAALLPLYAGCISKERAAALVKTIESEHVFGPAFPLPSVPLDSSWFNPVRYWQGPTWMNINWLIIDGLRRYGYKDHAAALVEISLELVQNGGFAEYFNPITGEALGASDFSWTAALTLDFLQK